MCKVSENNTPTVTKIAIASPNTNFCVFHNVKCLPKSCQDTHGKTLILCHLYSNTFVFNESKGIAFLFSDRMIGDMLFTFVCQSICLSVCLPVYLAPRLSVCLSTNLNLPATFDHYKAYCSHFSRHALSDDIIGERLVTLTLIR